MRENPCNEPCRYAIHKKCTCSCKGRNHSIGVYGKLVGFESEDIVVSPGMGGDLSVDLEQVLGKEFECWCKNIITVNEVLGYPHDGGAADRNGKKWWLFVHCPKCNYDWSLWKLLQNRIPMYERSLKEK